MKRDVRGRSRPSSEDLSVDLAPVVDGGEAGGGRQGAGEGVAVELGHSSEDI